MSQAPTARPAAPAAQLPLARQIRQILFIVLVTLVLGFALQPFVPRGPIMFVAASGAAGVAFLATALLRRGLLRDTLGGFRFTAVVLFVTAAFAAVGTLVLQGKPAEFYTKAYGPGVGSVIVALHLDDIFHGLPFAALLALFMAAVAVSAIRRWPIRLWNAGFFMVHVGLLVALLGAGFSATMSQKGRVDLRVGREQAETARLTRGGMPTGEEVPLGFTVRLDKFDVDKYESEYRVGVYLPDKKTNNYKLKASFDVPDKSEHRRLPSGDWYRIKGWYPDLATTERVVEVPTDGAPALRVQAGEREKWLFPGDRMQTADGKLVLFDFKKPAPPAGSSRHLLTVAGGEPKAVEVGGTLALPNGTSVKILRYFPHFSMDLATRSFVNVDDNPANPALEVEVAAAEGGGKRWLFANMPDFDHGRGSKLPMVYKREEGGGPAPTAVLVCAEERTVTVKTAEGERTVAYADGLEVPEAGVKLAGLLAQAKRVREPATKSQETLNPAVLLETSDRGRIREELLEAKRPEPVRLASGTILVFEKREDEVKAYRSLVTATAGSDSVQAEVAVNNPLSFKGWVVYQVNYDPKDPTYSGLEVVKDPGVPWVYLGLTLICIGVAWVYNVKPRLKKKRHPRPAPAAQAGEVTP